MLLAAVPNILFEYEFKCSPDAPHFVTKNINSHLFSLRNHKTFSMSLACHFCVKYYNSSLAADHFDEWQGGSAMSSSPSKFSPKLCGHAKYHLHHIKHSCYIGCNFILVELILRQHYISALPTCLETRPTWRPWQKRLPMSPRTILLSRSQKPWEWQVCVSPKKLGPHGFFPSKSCSKEELRVDDNKYSI